MQPAANAQTRSSAGVARERSERWTIEWISWTDRPRCFVVDAGR
jgi:hypothetical protein